MTERALPNVFADVTLHGNADQAKRDGWMCLCTATDRAQRPVGYHAWLRLNDQVLEPGQSLEHVGFVFSNDEGARELASQGHFYLREGTRVVGEARVVEPRST